MMMNFSFAQPRAIDEKSNEMKKKKQSDTNFAEQYEDLEDSEEWNNQNLLEYD